MGKPPVAATLNWQGDARFSAASGTQSLVLDGDGVAGPSPVLTLAFSIAACMAMDVIDIVRKGRHPVDGLEARVIGLRADDPPRRFTRIHLTFVVTGRVPSHAIERAIALSREKYCSVSNSLRPDIELVTTYEVQP